MHVLLYIPIHTYTHVHIHIHIYFIFISINIILYLWSNYKSTRVLTASRLGLVVGLFLI